jgi:hypothetical protein
VWRKGIPLGGKNNPYADLTYDELDALPIDPKDIESYKAKFLDAYIKGQIKKEEEAVKAAFEDALLDPKLKKRTIGYIRNQYELITAKFGKVDNVIDRNPDKFDGAETAKEYLSRATDIEDEINRRLYILDVIEEEEAGGIGEPLQVGD